MFAGLCWKLAATNAVTASALKRPLDRGAPYGTCRDHQTLRLQR